MGSLLRGRNVFPGLCPIGFRRRAVLGRLFRTRRRAEIVRKAHEEIRRTAQQARHLRRVIELLGGQLGLIPPGRVVKLSGGPLANDRHFKIVITPAYLRMLRQSGGVDSREEPLGVDLGLLLVFPACLLLPLMVLLLRLILPSLPLGLGFRAHALAGEIAGLRLFALQAAGISAAERLPGFRLAVPPEKRVSPLAGLPVRALELRLPPPALVVLFQHLLGGAAAGRFRQSVGQALLEILRQPGQGIGRLFRQLVLLEQPHVLWDQLLPDNLQPGQLRGGDFARRRHLVPHPAGELQPFLLQQV